jgi:hypothetical protein
MGGIVWLASYPKSGNTWLRAFLHNLLLNPDRPVRPNELNRFALGTRNAYWYRKYIDKPGDQFTAQELAQLRPQVQRDYTQAFPDSVFVKTHFPVADDAGAPLICMQHTAGAIYVVRNPLDVCLSAADHYGTGLDETIDLMADVGRTVQGDAHSVREPISAWSEHVASWTGQPNPRLHVMRYEDMLARPEETFGALARFLGLDPPRDRLRRAIEFSSFDTLRRLESKFGFDERSDKAERFFRAGKAGNWHTALTPGQAARIVDRHRAQMARFGYLPEDEA